MKYSELLYIALISRELDTVKESKKLLLDKLVNAKDNDEQIELNKKIIKINNYIHYLTTIIKTSTNMLTFNDKHEFIDYVNDIYENPVFTGQIIQIGNKLYEFSRVEYEPYHKKYTLTAILNLKLYDIKSLSIKDLIQ